MASDLIGANKTWELSLYEMNRTPQEAITDDTEIAVSPRSLHSELMCPICLEMLKKTMTTKECLHRFCSECIIRALRSGNKECPTCRKKLPSKRSLRPDPNFDLLISKIYPSRDEYEAHQTRVLEQLNTSQSQAAITKSINEGIELQSQSRNKSGKKSSAANADSATDSTLDVSGGDPVITPREDSDQNWPGVTSPDEVELVFKPHPNETDSPLIKTLKDKLVRYIKTTENATMSHMRNYLVSRGRLEAGNVLHEDDIELSVRVVKPSTGDEKSAATEYVALQNTDTLRYAVDTYGNSAEALQLFYLTKNK